jgi:hypothetical protein
MTNRMGWRPFVCQTELYLLRTIVGTTFNFHPPACTLLACLADMNMTCGTSCSPGLHAAIDRNVLPVNYQVWLHHSNISCHIVV